MRAVSAAATQCTPKVRKVFLPSANAITQGCGVGEKCGTKFDRRHAGVDFAGGGPGYAMADGDVVRIVKDKKDDHGFGNTVIVAHKVNCTSPAYVYTMYSHLASIRTTIKPGSKLSAGTRVGTAGATGASKGVHLHFEIKLSPVLGNPFGIGKANSYDCDSSNARPEVCFGYTGRLPSRYGDIDPQTWLKGAAPPNQSIP